MFLNQTPYSHYSDITPNFAWTLFKCQMSSNKGLPDNHAMYASMLVTIDVCAYVYICNLEMHIYDSEISV